MILIWFLVASIKDLLSSSSEVVSINNVKGESSVSHFSKAEGWLETCVEGNEDGDTVGKNEGNELGWREGLGDGCSNGESVGTCDGESDECSEGKEVGWCDGLTVGDSDGVELGIFDGRVEGLVDGCVVGCIEGNLDGNDEGVNEGFKDGWNEGISLLIIVGKLEGTILGDGDMIVGEAVSAVRVKMSS